MPTVIRKIKCPKQYQLKPGHCPYVQVPNPLLKNVSERAIVEHGLHRTIAKRDQFGEKVVDWSSFHQPEVTAAWAVEHCWDPLNPICKVQCKGRCLRGLQVTERSIKRLNFDKD